MWSPGRGRSGSAAAVVPTDAERASDGAESGVGHQVREHPVGHRRDAYRDVAEFGEHPVRLVDRVAESERAFSLADIERGVSKTKNT